MCIMEDVIEEVGLYNELENETLMVLGNVPFWLSFDDGRSGMGEASDTEDPETPLRQQVEGLRRDAP